MTGIDELKSSRKFTHKILEQFFMGDAWAGAVQVRSSGGGVVPQGPGVWNLSLIWPAPGASPVGTDAVYGALCRELAAAFARLGIGVEAQPVRGPSSARVRWPPHWVTPPSETACSSRAWRSSGSLVTGVAWHFRS